MKTQSTLPSWGTIIRKVISNLNRLRRADSTRGILRLILVFAMLIVMGYVGKFFIASLWFPDSRTAIPGPDGCKFDARSNTPVDRLVAEPERQYYLKGQTITIGLQIRNTGTCAWNSSMALHLESTIIKGLTSTNVITPAVPNGALYEARIAFTEPLKAGIYDTIWRMQDRNNQSFGTPFYSAITVSEPHQPMPTRPAPSPFVVLTRWMSIIVFIGPGIFAFVLAMYRSGLFLTEFYSLPSIRHGLAQLMRLLFVWRRISATAEGSEVRPNEGHEAVEKFGGPGILHVRSGTVVILERSHGFSRIAWPGKIELARFERVRASLSARKHTHHKTEAAYTKDGIRVRASISLSVQLMKQMEGEIIAPPKEPQRPLRELLRARFGADIKRPKDSSSVSSQAILLAVYQAAAEGPGAKVPPWETTVSGGMGSILAEKMLDQLWAMDDTQFNPRDNMVGRLSQEGTKKLSERGIQLLNLSIDILDVPEPKELQRDFNHKLNWVDKQRLQRWRTYWEQEARLREADGKAHALQLQGIARVEAQTDMLKAITQAFRELNTDGESRLSEVIALRFIDMIEEFAHLWLGDENRADYLVTLDTLRKLSSSSNGRSA